LEGFFVDLCGGAGRHSLELARRDFHGRLTEIAELLSIFGPGIFVRTD